MKTLFSSLAWLLLAGLLFVLCALFALFQDTSLFYSLFLWLGALLVILLFRLLAVTMGTLRENIHVRHFLTTFHFSRTDFLLREHWRSGARTLNRLNRLRAHMPWFVFIGRHNGKTTLLDSAPMPVLSHLGPRERVITTRTLKWWFFKQLCVLDVGSHFSKGDATSLRRWKRLVKWCKGVPMPQGVLVSISAQALLADAPAQLHEYGRHLRVQLECLLKARGRRLPLHVIVTGLDALPGFDSWQQTLTDEQREHALGYQWPHPPVVDRGTEFLEPLFDTLARGLLTQCLSSLSGTRPDSATAQRLAFPEQVEALKAGLLHFIVALCEPDPYHATGVLNGVWLTAAPGKAQASDKRQGHFIKALLGQRLSQASQPASMAPLGCYRKPSLAQVSFVLIAGALAWSGWQTYRLHDVAAHSGMPDPVARLVQLEAGFAQPLKHLPYLPLMKYLQARLERRLLNDQVWEENDHRAQLVAWQQQFTEADPGERREMIVQLGEALLLQDAMVNGQTLSVLEPLYQATNRFYPLTLAGEPRGDEALLLTRAWMARNLEAVPLAKQRALLSAWVRHDPTWRWLLETNEAPPPFRSTQFWPWWAHEVALPGVWTREGERQVQQELQRVSLALQGTDTPSLQSFWDLWQQRRQEAWLAFIGDTITQAQRPGRGLSSEASVALLAGQDPASRFIAQVAWELSSVPSRQSQQWLAEIRRVAHLQTLSQPANLADRLSVWEKWLRGWFHRQLGTRQAQAYASWQDRDAWETWKESLSAAVNTTLRPADLAQAAEGLLVRQPNDGKAASNTLENLQAAFVQLEEQMASRGQEAGTGAVWELLYTQVQALTANAVSVAACELEQQRQSQVLKPLNDPRLRQNPRRQEDMAWQLFQGFVSDKVRPYLDAEGSGGPSRRWQRQTMPFTAEFLHVLANATSPQDLQRLPLREETREQDELAALEQELVSLQDVRAAMREAWVDTTVVTQPATVPGGAAMMPTGTKLSLLCGQQETELRSANLREEGVFRWAPGQCQGVRLSVVFPHSELKRELRGDDAWPRFLQELADGEQRYPLEAFASIDQPVFSLQGVDEILVRFVMKGQEEALERWRAWLGVTRSLDQVQAQLSAMREAAQPQGNYFTGNMTALPAAAVQCRL